MYSYSLIDPPTGKILYNRPHKQLSTLPVFEEATFPTEVDTSASCLNKIKKTTDPDSASQYDTIPIQLAPSKNEKYG